MPNTFFDMSLFSSSSEELYTLALSNWFLTYPCYFPKRQPLFATFWPGLNGFFILPRRPSENESKLQSKPAVPNIFRAGTCPFPKTFRSRCPALAQRYTSSPLPDGGDFNHVPLAINGRLFEAKNFDR